MNFTTKFALLASLATVATNVTAQDQLPEGNTPAPKNPILVNNTHHADKIFVVGNNTKDNTHYSEETTVTGTAYRLDDPNDFESITVHGGAPLENCETWVTSDTREPSTQITPIEQPDIKHLDLGGVFAKESIIISEDDLHSVTSCTSVGINPGAQIDKMTMIAHGSSGVYTTTSENVDTAKQGIEDADKQFDLPTRGIDYLTITLSNEGKSVATLSCTEDGNSGKLQNFTCINAVNFTPPGL